MMPTRIYGKPLRASVTQDTVEETAQRLIDGAGHASNVDLGRAGERIDTNAENYTPRRRRRDRPGSPW